MSTKQFRFIHASDFHLETPFCGVSDAPKHLREILTDAPYHAAERVFDAAISEHVDFVILAGDIVHPYAAGPRGLDFLHRQFERLHERHIAVYWCGGREDRTELWPAALALPHSVHTFPENRVSALVVRRDDETVAMVQGCANRKGRRIRASDFGGDGSRFTIAVAHGACDAKMLRKSRIDFWALGGQHNRHTLFTSPHIAQYCGSPQGRSPQETGSHGCTLVDVGDDGVASRQTIETDVVRWHAERIELPDHMDRDGLLRQLRERTRQLAEKHANKYLMVHWRISDRDQLTDTRSDQLAAQLRQSGLARELVTKLRNEFGASEPGVWTVALEADTPVVFPAGWYEEDTVLGDLLRAVQQYQKEKHLEVDLAPWNSAVPLPPELSEALQILGPEDRKQILQEVAALGVDLLRGDRVLSEELTAVTS